MRNRRNYYRVLNVQPDAPAEVIRASYHAIMQRLKVHPDLGGDHEQAALVNEAFRTLSDPDRRAAYDRASGRPAAQRRGRDVPAPPEPTAAPPTSSPARGVLAGGPSCAFCGAASAASEVERPESVCASCGSALFPARRYRGDSGSRRAIERLPRRLAMTFRVASSREVVRAGTTEDVSLNGMRFLSPVAIAAGERVRIECDFCSAVAVVKGVRPGDAHQPGLVRCGVEFLTLRVKRERGGLLSADA